MKISALQNLFDSHSCYRGITNSTTRFGPTKMSSMQLSLTQQAFGARQPLKRKKRKARDARFFFLVDAARRGVETSTFISMENRRVEEPIHFTTCRQPRSLNQENIYLGVTLVGQDILGPWLHCYHSVSFTFAGTQKCPIPLLTPSLRENGTVRSWLQLICVQECESIQMIFLNSHPPTFGIRVCSFKDLALGYCPRRRKQSLHQHCGPCKYIGSCPPSQICADPPNSGALESLRPSH